MQCNIPTILGPVVSVGTGHNSTYAVQSDGRIIWFVADHGFPGPGPWTAVAAGWLHSCVVRTEGRAECFGYYNNYGGLDGPGDMVATMACDRPATSLLHW